MSRRCFAVILQSLALPCFLVAAARAQSGFGELCTNNDQCISGYCADGRFCAPPDGTGRAGEYCHHDNHCASYLCDCDPQTGGASFCRDWERGNHGACLAKKEYGEVCTRNENCLSDYCADGHLCAPRDGTGETGVYCHHDNHCASYACSCAPRTGGPSFCSDWERGVHGECEIREPGMPCNRNENCSTGYCADGRVCAPRDGEGTGGMYCHHGNHCVSHECVCPDGVRTRGFCPGYEKWHEGGPKGTCA